MKKALSYFSFLCIAASCIFSEQCASCARNAVNICLGTLLPSLFPFFVFAEIFILSGGAYIFAKPLSRITKPLFKMDGTCAVPIFLGILCGYPVGAKTAAEMYADGEISKSDAERLCGFCNNSGPLFLIGAVGGGMLGSVKTGYLLYAVHVTSAFAVGTLTRGKENNFSALSPHPRIQNRIYEKNIFVTAVEKSITSILNVFGYVIIFSYASAFLKNPFIGGIFEITNALSEISNMTIPNEIKFVFSAFFVSWGGISVHMQTLGILSKYSLSFKKYISAKLAHAFIAFLLALTITKFISPAAHVFLPNVSESRKYVFPMNFASGICITISGIYLLHLNIIITGQKRKLKKDGRK